MSCSPARGSERLINIVCMCRSPASSSPLWLVVAHTPSTSSNQPQPAARGAPTPRADKAGTARVSLYSLTLTSTSVRLTASRPTPASDVTSGLTGSQLTTCVVRAGAADWSAQHPAQPRTGAVVGEQKTGHFLQAEVRESNPF